MNRGQEEMQNLKTEKKNNTLGDPIDKLYTQIGNVFRLP